jgi:putative N6-adenine-specific DNA methylase
LRLKDAIVDHFYKKHNRRPDVELQNPDVIFHLHVSFNDVTISMDSSGPGLYKRGYRVETTEAPMNEVLAAGIIKLSGWDGKKPFLDPMCGSGTFPIEAAMIAQNNAPNFYRNDFAFQKWDDFDEDAYEQARMELLNSGHKAKLDIQGSDNNQGVLGIAKGNVRKAFLDDFIEIEKANFHDLDRNGESGFMIINPPYDERMYLDDAIQYYKDIGDTLKQRFNGWECWIVSSHKQALKQMGLKADAKIDLYNGPLEIRLNQYRIF